VSPAPSDGGAAASSSSSIAAAAAAAARCRVAVRVRPYLPHELAAAEGAPPAGALELSPELCHLVLRRGVWDAAPEPYTFDAVFDERASQRRVYDEFAAPVVAAALEAGTNGAVLVYGQTGGGKTHTLGRLPSAPGDAARGVAPRALEDTLGWADAQRSHGAVVSVSAQYVQVYLDAVFDLLSEEHAPVAIAEDRATGEVLLQGAACAVLACAADGEALLREGEARRVSAATRLNAASSRSHAILALTITLQPPPAPPCAAAPPAASSLEALLFPSAAAGPATPRRSKLLLVDLAGSERISRSGVAGIHAEEAKAVNLSLTALGKCVAALAAPAGTVTHVPFRDSRLTRVLRDALGGRCRASLIACVAPGRDAAQETAATLGFAARARAVTENSAPRQQHSGSARADEPDYRALCRRLAAQVDALHIAHEGAIARAAAAEAAAADAAATAAARDAGTAATHLSLLAGSGGGSGAGSPAAAEGARVAAALHAEAAAAGAGGAGAVAAARAEVVAAVVAVSAKRADAAEAAQRAAEARIRLCDAQASVLRATAEAASAAAAAAEARAAEAEARAELAEGAAAEMRAEAAAAAADGNGAAAPQTPPPPSPPRLGDDISSGGGGGEAAFDDALSALRQALQALPADGTHSGDADAAYLQEGRLWLAAHAARQRRSGMAIDAADAAPSLVSSLRAALSAAAEAAARDASALAALCAGLRCGDADARLHAAKLLANAAADEAAAALIVTRAAPLRALVDALRVHTDVGVDADAHADAAVRARRCAAGALANLAMTEAHAGALVASGAVGALCAAATGCSDAQTQRCAAGALANLCGNEAVEAPLFSEGALRVLAALAGGDNADVAAQAARGLANAARSAAGRDALRDAGAAAPLRALAASPLAAAVRLHVDAALAALAALQEAPAEAQGGDAAAHASDVGAAAAAGDDEARAAFVAQGVVRHPGSKHLLY
jgi:hypothetical protein